MIPSTKSGAVLVLFCSAAVGTACTGSSGEEPEASVPTWALVEELRIGSHDDPDHSLTSPLRLTLGTNGHLYIAQPQTGEIWQYDSAGQLVRRIGGKGEGPGEFNQLLVVGMLGDTLYASNLSPGRVSFFSLDGTHLSTSALVLEPRNEYELATPPYRLLPDGSAVVTPARYQDAIGSGEARTVTFLRMNRSGNPLNTLFSHSAPTGVVIPLGDGTTLGTRRPLPDHPLMTIAEDGSRIAVLERYAVGVPEGAEFRLTELTLSGDTLSSTAYSYRPIPVPQEIADSLMADLVLGASRVFGSESAAERAVKAAFRLPTHYPPVTSLLYADDLGLWLAREDRPDFTRQWEVYAEHHKIGQLTIPSDTRVLIVQEEKLWALELDEYDVPYVVRYRIDRSSN